MAPTTLSSATRKECQASNEAKYNVKPLQQMYNHSFKKQEIALIESIIEEKVEVIIDRWKAHFAR